MDSISVNQFRDNLKRFVEQVVSEHLPIKVTRRSGADFVVIAAEDWEREQETLFVLQNTGLMRQIAESSRTHADRSGHVATKSETDEILGL
jgi:antitoxin YefM